MTTAELEEARRIDDAILRGAFDEVPKTLSVEDAKAWWEEQVAQGFRSSDHWSYVHCSALLRFVRGGLSTDEISLVGYPKKYDEGASR